MSPETEALLARYAALVTAWNPAINLVSARDLASLRTRHIDDSLQIAELAPPSGHWVDLGSGGGFPGIVAAIATRTTDLRFTLLESDQRKCAFLRTVVRELGLTHVTVRAARIEEAAPLAGDIVSARALAALPQLLHYAHRHLTPAGTALLPKGAQWQDEVRDAETHWAFDLEVHPSKTDKRAAVLELTNLRKR